MFIWRSKQEKKKDEYVWLQEIDHDPREERFRQEKSHDDLVKITTLMQSKVISKLNDPRDEPTIFPLLRKLYLQGEKAKAKPSNEIQVPKNFKEDVAIMEQKIEQFVENTCAANQTAKQFLDNLVFSDSEINYVENATVDQWKSRDWFLHKVGFISASKCKDVFTRETTLERKGSTETTALATSFASQPSIDTAYMVKEEEARKFYLSVVRKQHHRVQLQHKGFQISKKKPFLGAGICVGNSFSLAKNSKYYYQVQMKLFVVGAKVCDFVVWTTKAIYTIAITFDPLFMNSVSVKLETFWVNQVFPNATSIQGNAHFNFMYRY